MSSGFCSTYTLWALGTVLGFTEGWPPVGGGDKITVFMKVGCLWGVRIELHTHGGGGGGVDRITLFDDSILKKQYQGTSTTLQKLYRYILMMS